MKRLLTTLLLIALCSAVYALDYDSPYDPGAARTDLSNVSGAADLTLSGKVRAAWADILGDVYASGTLIVGSGSVSVPALAPSSDTNTGIYFPAADTIGFIEGGAEAFRLNSGGEVLIATSTDFGNYKLQILGGETVRDSSGNYTDIVPSALTLFGETGAPKITLDGSTLDGKEYRIYSTTTGSTAGAGSFAIYDAASGTFRLLMKPTGNVLINTTTDDATNKLQVSGSIISNSSLKVQAPSGGDSRRSKYHRLYSSSLADSAYLDLTVENTSRSFNCLVLIHNAIATDASKYTSAMYHIVGRSTTVNATSLNTVTGSTGATFTITSSGSSGVVRFTNTAGAATEMSITIMEQSGL